MKDQHRATESEWYYVKNRTGHGKSDLVAYSCILELRDRIKALEAAQPAQPDHPEIPGGSLLSRVACADGPADAIREVAAWLREEYGPSALRWAMRLELQAER